MRQIFEFDALCLWVRWDGGFSYLEVWVNCVSSYLWLGGSRHSRRMGRMEGNPGCQEGLGVAGFQHIAHGGREKVVCPQGVGGSIESAWG